MDLEPGNYTLRLEKPGYLRYEEIVNIAAKSTKEVDIELASGSTKSKEEEINNRRYPPETRNNVSFFITLPSFELMNSCPCQISVWINQVYIGNVIRGGQIRATLPRGKSTYKLETRCRNCPYSYIPYPGEGVIDINGSELYITEDATSRRLQLIQLWWGEGTLE